MIYDRYAAVYDASGQVRFALLVAVYLRELLAKHPISGQRLLDLACGTGTLAGILAGEGWHVVGLDSSAAMLAQAEAKIQGAQLAGSADFVLGDMRQADQVLPPCSFDLVTCTYDSLNYLAHEADLAQCFRSVERLLAPGGLLIADMNTRHFLEFDWGDFNIRELSGFIQVEQSHFDQKTGAATMVLTGFLGDDSAGYERFDEVHVEWAYPTETINRLLAESGLEIEGLYDSFTLSPPVATTQRIFWVARKPM